MKIVVIANSASFLEGVYVFVYHRTFTLGISNCERILGRNSPLGLTLIESKESTASQVVENCLKDVAGNLRAKPLQPEYFI